MYAKIVVTEGPNQGLSFDLPPDAKVVSIGRSRQCILHLDDPKLSRVHCLVRFHDNAFYLEDKESTNGTYINTQKLVEKIRLATGDVIRLGHTALQFEEVREPPRPADPVAHRATASVARQERRAAEPLPRVGPRITETMPRQQPNRSTDRMESLSTIRNYRLIKRIGSGGIGEVYKAIHPVLGREVAVKILRADSMKEESIVARFIKEAKACSVLDHPGIVKVFDYDEHNGTPFIVMEYIKGQSLSEIINTRGPFAVRQALEIARQAVDALAHAHERKIIHRDLKPANILIESETGLVKLIDLGLVKVVKESGMTFPSLTLSGQAMGTPRYMPPEQIEDAKSVDARADIYALGCTLYHMLCGRPPFYEIDSKNMTALLEHIYHSQPRSLTNFVDLPPTIVQLVEKTMSKSPADRYPSAVAMREALDEEIKRLASPG